MKINELSKKSGINLETIRYYEKTGLLPEPKRAANGYRVYDQQSLSQLNFIKSCRWLGFSIDEIKQLNELKNTPKHHCVADEMILSHLKQVEEKIARLLEIQTFLQNLVNHEEHSVEECRAISGLSQER
ncbi:MULTISPECIES: Cd(II)/Pb(II)-responsive transcriptional regulator [Basfia]|nr:MULTISPECIES: Cd(II)/Pb(II)-responsive transcriptional regulator [Basfia]QIM68728.1 MerR family transcriptional regulator [Basfia succiniciproducens]SCX99353.1 DNA-binding transcriptional regulator, MerR family [Basfia succiniciproducens]SEP79772.1 DNA-binding transcriptional regulator, MerR family [Basfia succiniciproducens]